MTLKDWIEKLGQKEVARRLDVTIGCVSHWSRGTRRPRPEMAAKIIGMSTVTWKGIYG